MRAIVFYFSGTGNSLAVARSVAQHIKADLEAIPKVMNIESIQLDTDCIGIVFPSYMAPISGLPLMVERFVKRIANIQSIRIFAVCTCGGYECVNALPSLHKLKRTIRACGGRLSEAYSTRLPMNNLDYDHIPVPISRDHGIILRRSQRKIEKICSRILTGKGTRFSFAKMLFGLLMAPLYRLMRQPVTDALIEKAKEPADTKLGYNALMPFTDRSITVNEKCNGCGICAKVCSGNNIQIVEKRPQFQHHCEMCFACDEWCPAQAIQHWSRATGVKYHHPEVQLADMLKR